MTKIIASNQLNEMVIKSLINEQNAPIDAFGIGTELATGKPDAALDGVYKLAEVENNPKMKISENIEKVTLPGKKQVYRIFDGEGNFFRDAILLENENMNDVEIIYHRVYPEQFTSIRNFIFEPLLHKVVVHGEVKAEQQSISQIHEYLMQRSSFLPDEHKRFISPHLYKVGISKKLMETRNTLASQLKTKK